MILLIINNESIIKGSPRPSPRHNPVSSPLDRNIVVQSNPFNMAKRKGVTANSTKLMWYTKKLSTLKTIKFSIAFLMKIKSWKQKLVQQIKNSQKVFEAIDKNYEERVLCNVRNVKFYHENVLFKNKLLKRIAARSIEFSTTKSVPSIYNSPNSRKSLMK